MEWALSEAAGFDAGYAMTISPHVLKNHGHIDMLLEAIKNWDFLRYNQAFTEEQQARLRDPKTEWHLEKVDDTQYNLYQLNISDRYHCNLQELQPGQPAGSDWSIESPYSSNCAVRLYVDGDGSIKNPKVRTADGGMIVFPCTIEGGQYLLYEFSGEAVVTDKNYNVVKNIIPNGKLSLTEGTSNISFYCDRNEGSPEVVLRFITRSEPESVRVK
ncbi:MAG: hypothetical protein PHU62_05865 [Bacteroidales bacterium]|nr:hypothetical protein [Bacteroidales bacterium]MDD2205340.1 hypothetical protein [Bacteroidales bacterium]MDD3152768.1 hypothetical protein [Bacteroidales bacterium]MDD3914129.1 hypothetical protein [Bacteroidales bacterium]MDD4634081.1 hypothetical protein [Bacteroidales bacterium]